MRVLVFGNLLLKEDSLPLRLIPRLKKAFLETDFLEMEPSEGVENYGRDLVIIDSVEGIDEVVVIDSIEKLQTSKLYSMHDFDLGYNLKILKKLGKIDSVKIIGVPMDIGEEEGFDQVQLIFKKWAAQDMQGS